MALLSTSNEFPGFANLFWPTEGDVLGAYRGDTEDIKDPFAITRGLEKHRTPVVVRYFMGGAKMTDFLWTGYGSFVIIVNQRVVDLMSANSFTGWTTYQVAVFDRFGRQTPGYHGLAVVGRCGPRVITVWPSSDAADPIKRNGPNGE